MDDSLEFAQRRRSRAAVMGVVVFFHVAGCWIVVSSVRPAPPLPPPSFGWVVIAPQHRTEAIRSTGAAPELPSPAILAAPPSLISIPLPQDETPQRRANGTSETDWDHELQIAARHATADDASKNVREFGPPHHVTSAAQPPAFDWDPVHTHRVETMSGGGVLVRLSDRCFMVFIPFPFPVCGIGKKEANGHLLDHIHDAPNDGTP